MTYWVSSHSPTMSSLCGATTGGCKDTDPYPRVPKDVHSTGDLELVRDSLEGQCECLDKAGCKNLAGSWGPGGSFLLSIGRHFL